MPDPLIPKRSIAGRFAPRWKSLRTKIIAWSFIPAIIVLTAVALATFYAFQQVTEDLVIERDQELARLTAGELANSLQEYPGLLAAVGRDLDSFPYGPPVQPAALARVAHRLVYFDAGAILLNNLGHVVATEPSRPEILGQDWSTRVYFRQLIQGTAEPAFSDVVADGPQGAAVIAIATPILGDDDEFLGALVGMFRVDAESISPFYGTLLRLRIERKGNAYVLDGGGRVIYASDRGRIGSVFGGHPVAPEALGGQVGALRALAPDGREILASYGPVPNTRWSLIVEEDWEDLTRPIRFYGQALLALLGLGLLIPAVVVMVGVRRITGPIGELVEATRQVAGGNFGQTVSPNTGDELEALADQFNRMSAELKQSYTQLEQRVEERTRQLSTLLRIVRDVTSTLELEPLLGQILDQLKMVIDYGGAGILALEEGMLRFRAYRGPAPAEVVSAIQFPAPGTFAERVISGRQPVIVGDLQDDSPESAAIPEASRERLLTVFSDLRSLLAVPLVVKEQAIGTLALFHGHPHHFSAQDSEMALAFARQAAVAIENARLFEAGRRRAEQFRVINEVGQRITSILDVDVLLNQTARLTRETFGYYHVHIGLIEDGEVVFKTLRAGPPDDPQFARCESVRLKVGGAGLTAWVAAAGEPVLVQDVSRDSRYVPAGDEDPTCAELVLPIKVKGQVIGVLSMESDRPYAFDDSDTAVAQSLASQVAVAIENARLYAAEQRRAEQFRAISEVGRRITSLLAVDELLLQTGKLIREIFGYYYISIGLVEGDELIVKTDCPCDRPRLKVGEEGVMGWVAGSGQPLLVADTSQEPRYLSTISSTRTRSELALPIKVKDQIVGVLNVESDRPNDFDDSDQAVLHSLANQLAVAIENARLYEQAGQLAALEERQKLARELHDSVSQALYGIALGARTARTLLDRDPSRLAEPLDYVLSLAEAGLAEMRALIFELRPESLEREGLVAALAKQADSLRARYHLEVHTTFGDEPPAPLAVKEALYRIAQEALHNIVKHSQAKRVNIRLGLEAGASRPLRRPSAGVLVLEISDNGVGFDPNGDFPGHLGLRSMRERAERIGGAFEIDSAPARGTSLRIYIVDGLRPR